MVALLVGLSLAGCRPNAEETPAAPSTPQPPATASPLPTSPPAPASAQRAPAAAVTAPPPEGQGETQAESQPESQPESPLAASTPARIPAYTFHVVNVYPHDVGAYTQGLQFVDGQFYEGTGRKGASSLRRVEIDTGEVLQQHDLGPEYFGEGITVLDDRIWQLTWQERTAFLYDRATFAELEQVAYPTEGWGLTTDGERLIMSDGSDVLYFRDMETFAEIGQLPVRYLGAPLTRLNELEYIDGEIWANVYQTNYIVRIDPATGAVVGVVDLTGLLDGVPVSAPVDVLNGIAWDAASDRLFVTGKWWPAVFEITLEQAGWAQ